MHIVGGMSATPGHTAHSAYQGGFDNHELHDAMHVNQSALIMTQPS